MTSRQLAEWMAYFGVHPFGEDYSQMMMAQVASLIYNSNRGKNAPAVKAEDFLPKKREQQTPADMRRVLKGVLSGYHKDHQRRDH